MGVLECYKNNNQHILDLIIMARYLLSIPITTIAFVSASVK